MNNLKKDIYEITNVGNGKKADTKDIIKKWYNKLRFDKVFDEEFAEGIEAIQISDKVSIETYDKQSTDGMKNLLSFLFMCEALSQKYAEKGIGEDVLTDTLKDLVRWTNTWSKIKGELYLGELEWLSRHLGFKLFKLDRLQFCFGSAEHNYDALGIKKGENVIEIHIPQDGPLNIEECQKSVAKAKEFFKHFFPEYEYKYFTCHSWLLDDNLKKLLCENSNIIKFGDMFEKVHSDIDDSIIQYIFGWDVRRPYVSKCVCKTSFAQKIKDYIAAGGEFHITYGILKE